MREDNDTMPHGMDRRSALKTIGAASLGVTGIGAAVEGIATTATGRPAPCPNCGDVEYPVTMTEETEEKFEYHRNAASVRHGVFRKVTQLTQSEPDYDDINGEVEATIEITNLTECRYTNETIEEHNLSDPACYQQNTDEITVSHPEYDPKKVRFDFVPDNDHVAGLEAPDGGDTGKEAANVGTDALQVALNILQGMSKAAGKVLARVTDVKDAYALANSLYQWYDDTASLGYSWNWQRPNHAPDELPEAWWASGRACTTSWMKFEMQWDDGLYPEFTVQNTTFGSAHGRTHELTFTPWYI